MKASTLFTITGALLIGLTAATIGKMAGLFESKPAAPAAAPEKKLEIPVLVAAQNLFAGQALESRHTRVRALRPEEMPHFQQHKDQYLPAMPNAAALRITQKHIEADQPILRTSLEELGTPDRLSLRLLPYRRAINLAVPKDQSAGGLIQTGDWVDVSLESAIEGGQCGTAPITRSATLVHKVRVIAKRNSLWPFTGALPDDQPVNYTVEANLYRAALLEFAKEKGRMTLVALSAAEQQRLETTRNAWLRASKNGAPTSADAQVMTFAEPDSAEYKDEDQRVTAMTKGELTVGQTDLVRIFGLKQDRLSPEIPPLVIETYSGVQQVEPFVFTAVGRRIETGPDKGSSSGTSGSCRGGDCGDPTLAYQFRMPSGAAPKRKG